MQINAATDTPPYLKPRLFSIVMIVCALALAGFMLVARYAQMDQERDLKTWQDKLNLIADSRTAAVAEWVDGHFGEMKKLAQNPSLQLYLTELSGLSNQAEGRPMPAEPAQKSYLRNLLIFTADRMAFAPQSVPLSLQIPTQIPYAAQSGIAVLDRENNLIVSTPYLSELEPQVREKLARVPAQDSGLLDMFRGEKGVVNIGFSVPVYAIQGDAGSSAPIARIIGLKPVGDALFKLLRHPGATEKTLASLLVRRDGDNVTYLSPLSEGGGALEKSLAAKPETLAEAYALASPDSFGEGRDHANTPVLFTSRAVPGTPWTLVQKIDYDEAMAPGQARRNGMIFMLILVIGVVVLTVGVVWYGASSRRAITATRFFKELAAASRAKEKLLKLVADNQPEAIYILDRELKYRFSNHTASTHADMRAEDMLGKPIADVLGAGRAQDIVDSAEAALFNQHKQSRVRRLNEGGAEIIIRSEFVPLDHIPLPGLPENTPGVLVVEQDISEVVHERERRLRLHRQLIDTLIAIVDKRDPHAANHSLLVSQIAHEVAEAMGLDAALCETTRIAGSLMNIGKIVIPAQVLTKRDHLSDDEKRALRDSLASSAELIRGISFEGPVVETLQQVQERWDGTGPEGLREDGILITARIIGAVNAFVGMISPRSYRAAMPVEAALRALLEKVDAAYDRKVVVALSHYIDNQGGRMMLEQLRAAA